MGKHSSSLCFLIIGTLLLMGSKSSLAAGGPVTIRLFATHYAILADGAHSTTLRAEVRDDRGRYVTDSNTVQFHTTAGTLSPSQSPIYNGIATTTLTSSPIAGIAHVHATTFSGGGSPPIEVIFTDDPKATFEGNNYMLIVGTGYLAYSATDKVIEANGKDGGAKVNYRNIEISADRMQLHCEDSVLHARDNVTIKRGTNIIKATRLYYNLITGQGYALAELDSKLQAVIIQGENLRIEPSPTPIPTSFVNLPDLSVKLLIVSKSITYFPGDRLQFRRAHFFQDNLQVLSLPVYEIGLYSTELFSDHFFSVGTNGFGLELPLYYDLTPRSTGIVYLRHQQQLGRGFYDTSPGWGIDVIQGYSAQGSKHYEGAFGFTGLTRSDWAFRWNHNQEFSPGSQGTFYLEFPGHQSVYSSANFSQQMKQIRWGANLSGGQSFSSNGITTSRNNVFIETKPHQLLGLRNFQYTIGSDYTMGETQSRDTNITSYRESNENLNIRAFMRPKTLDSRTTLNTSFTLGHVWSDTAGSGPSALATVGLDHTFRGGGAVNVSYDMVVQPRGVFNSGGRHRISANYNLTGNKKFQASLFGSAFLDATDASIIGDLAYKLDRHWRLISLVTVQRFDVQNYSDLEFTVGRRIGTRELQLTYSTYRKKVSFDMTATRF